MRISDAEARAVRTEIGRQAVRDGLSGYLGNKARLTALDGRRCPVCRFFGLRGVLLWDGIALSCGHGHGYSNASVAEQECAEDRAQADRTRPRDAAGTLVRNTYLSDALRALSDTLREC